MNANSLPGDASLLDDFAGEIITRESANYDEAREVWNRDAIKDPLVVVHPRNEDDVVRAVRYAKGAGLVTAVRCGGHSYQGHSTVEDGVVIDLSAHMGQVTLDPKTHLVTAQGGALLGDVDRVAVPHNRVMPAGIVSHTGMGGLALGGGVGYLTRSFGMTCDQFVSLRVVTADGDVVVASETENAELFWALKGGGGNFGIVTEFTCTTHELGPIQGGPLLYTMDGAVDVIESFAELMKDAPRELSLTMSLGMDPTLERFEALLSGMTFEEGQRLLLVNVIYRGAPEDEILSRVRAVGQPVLDGIHAADFLKIQSSLDQVSQHGVGWYMKSGHAMELTRPLIEQMVTSSLQYSEVRVPEVQREAWVIQTLGGAASDLPDEATAYSGRESNWHVAIEVGFLTAEQRADIVAWTRGAWAKTEQLLDMSTSYVNMNFEETPNALARIYGEKKLERLQAVKAQFDPENFFRRNSNIEPAKQPQSAVAGRSSVDTL